MDISQYNNLVHIVSNSLNDLVGNKSKSEAKKLISKEEGSEISRCITDKINNRTDLRYVYRECKKKVDKLFNKYGKPIRSKRAEIAKVKSEIADKFFYLFVNLVYHEQIKRSNSINNTDLNYKLIDIIEQRCNKEKTKLGSCIANNRLKIHLIPVNKFGDGVKAKCKREVSDLSKCVNIPVILK